MYCDAMHIPNAFHWGEGEKYWGKYRAQNKGTVTEDRHSPEFEMPKQSDGTVVQGNSKDTGETRAHAIEALVHEVAKRLGVTKEFKVAWDPNPFATPAAGVDGKGQDTMWIPSIWLIDRDELSEEAKPLSRESPSKTRPRLETLKADLHNAGIRFDQEIPHSIVDLLVAQEVWGLSRALDDMNDDQRSMILYFILAHEVGHIHYGHCDAARLRGLKQKSALFGIGVALLIASLGAAAFPLLRHLPLKDLIAAYSTIGAVAIGAGVFAGKQRVKAYDRQDELEADQFAIYGISTKRDRLGQRGGGYFFENATYSGRTARTYSPLRRLMFKKNGDLRLIFDSEHPPLSKRKKMIGKKH